MRHGAGAPTVDEDNKASSAKRVTTPVLPLPRGNRSYIKTTVCWRCAHFFSPPLPSSGFFDISASGCLVACIIGVCWGFCSDSGMYSAWLLAGSDAAMTFVMDRLCSDKTNVRHSLCQAIDWLVRSQTKLETDKLPVRFGSPVSSKMVVYGHCLVTLPTQLMKHYNGSHSCPHHSVGDSVTSKR